MGDGVKMRLEAHVIERAGLGETFWANDGTDFNRNVGIEVTGRIKQLQ